MKNQIRKKFMLLFAIVLALALAGCGKKITADFGNAEAFEAAINDGTDPSGKVVMFRAMEIHPESALGHNIWAGEHLNFISIDDPGIKEGQTVSVRVISGEKALGSWVLSYEVLDNVVIDDTTCMKYEGTESADTEAAINTDGLNGADENAGDNDNGVSGSTNAKDNSVDVEGLGNYSDVSETSADSDSAKNQDSEISFEYVKVDAAAFKNFNGEPTISAYVAVKNTGDTTIAFKDVSLDYEDNDGKLLATDSFANCIPEALKPGQTGYIYSYYFDITDVPLDNGLNVVPSGSFEIADNYYEIETSDVSFKKSDFLDLKVIGRGTNNGSEDKTFLQIGAVYFDAEGNVVGFCYGFEDFPAGQTKSFEISGDMMSEDMSADVVDHVEVYIQGDSWY